MIPVAIIAITPTAVGGVAPVAIPGITTVSPPNAPADAPAEGKPGVIIPIAVVVRIIDAADSDIGAAGIIIDR
jgi:hypothetical protein